MDFQRMILLFMEYCASKQLRPKTMHAYEKTLRLFAKWLQENEEITKADAVKEMHIRRYLLELQSRGKYTACSDEHSKKINFPENRSDYNEKVSNITINNYLRNMRVFFAWMEESECIVKSPMKRIKLLPAKRKAKEFLEDDEVKALMRVMDKSLFSEYRDLLIMMIMLDSGTRLGETLSITNEELNVMDHTIYLPADKTKGRKERTVFFSQKTAREMRHWLQFRDRFVESDYVFPVRSTGRMMKVPKLSLTLNHQYSIWSFYRYSVCLKGKSMKFGKMPSSWIDLQNQVCLLLTEAGFTANSPKTIQTVRGKIEVDVYAEHKQDLISKIICECKFWETNIPQEKVHAFRTVVHDSGAMLGLIITKTGFQVGAYEVAKYTNVQLLTWSEFCELVFEKWIATQLEKLRMLSAACIYFSDDYNFPYENVINELRNDFYRLRKSISEHKHVGAFITKGDLLSDKSMLYYKKEDFEYIEDYLRFLIAPLEKAYRSFLRICCESNIPVSKTKIKHYCLMGPRWDDETNDLEL